jgi:hypothetical protein
VPQSCFGRHHRDRSILRRRTLSVSRRMQTALINPTELSRIVYCSTSLRLSFSPCRERSSRRVRAGT